MRKYVFQILLMTMLLGIHDGYLAIYDSASSSPRQVLPYRAALYPNADQQALAEGIPFRSQQELSRLLEDFLS